MEGLYNKTGEITSHSVEKNTEPTIVQEWTEADLEITHDDVRVFDDANSDSQLPKDSMANWLDKVTLEDLEKMDSIDDLYEKLSMPAEDPVDISGDDEGPQKVKRR